MAIAANAAKAIIQTQQGWRSLIKPYIFSTFAIGVSVTTGDFICQYLQRNKKSKNDDTTLTQSSSLLPWWNRQRSLIMCTTAVFVTTPWSFTLSRTVERLFPVQIGSLLFPCLFASSTGKQGAQIAKKMLTNSLLAPLGISLVFTSVTLLKGQSLREARIKVKNDMPKTFLAGSCYWPFVSFINFRFIPLNYRPFVGSLAGAVWNIYISSVANKTVESSNDTQQSLTLTTTTLIAETSGTAVPALREAWNILDHNKKDL